jgi:competence protein CoiA
MSQNAILKSSGEIVWASYFTENDWKFLKQNYAIGDYLTTCCGANAVPKTSINGEQFFAHNAGECSTAPETVWHQTGKMLVKSGLGKRGIICQEERSGKNPDGSKWKADTYFEFNNRRIVIEIQHSSQTLEKYLKRQKIYQEAGIECIWLLYPERFLTLNRATANHRMRFEFNNIFPKEGYFHGCIKELPVAYLVADSAPIVRGVAGFEATLDGWLDAILEEKFRYQDGRWMIFE